VNNFSKPPLTKISTISLPFYVKEYQFSVVAEVNALLKGLFQTVYLQMEIAFL